MIYGHTYITNNWGSSVVSFRIFKTTKKYFTKLLWRIKNRSHKHIISKFAEKVGLVYFGFVNQHSDEHKVVLGLTVSSTHQDNHYCTGSIGGYNLSIVDRSDYRHEPDGSTVLYNWTIFAFDLHTKMSIPHFFIGAQNRDLQPFAALFSTFPNMKEIEFGANKNYNSEFTSRFSIYARPAKSAEIQKILSAKITKVLGAHLWPFSVEQHNGVLYLYSTNERITPGLIDTMMENGLWLAGQLDLQPDTEIED